MNTIHDRVEYRVPETHFAPVGSGDTVRMGRLDFRVVLEPVLPARRLPAALRASARTGAFLSVTAGMLSAASLHRALAGDAVFGRWQHAWYRALLDLFGTRIALAGDPAAASKGGRLVVANHRSTLDIAVLGWLFGGRLVSRADVARWPLLGAAARAAGTIFVERGRESSGANAVRAIRAALEEGATIALFPEGTTHEDDVVRPFRRGAFAAAVAAHVPVVPVGLAYDSSRRAIFGDETFPRHLARVAASPGITVAVRVGAPLPPGLAAAELASAAHAAVQALVLDARADCAALEARP